MEPNQLMQSLFIVFAYDKLLYKFKNSYRL